MPDQPERFRLWGLTKLASMIFDATAQGRDYPPNLLLSELYGFGKGVHSAAVTRLMLRPLRGVHHGRVA